MKHYRQILAISGVLCFFIAFFQIGIGFSPSLSLYFGAPEKLVSNIYYLISVCLILGSILGIFGLYAISGAGYIRTLPWLKQMLAVISAIFILRGLFVVPEALVVIGTIQSSMNVPPRFIAFSIGSLLIGFFFVTGTMGVWRSFSSKN